LATIVGFFWSVELIRSLEKWQIGKKAKTRAMARKKKNVQGKNFKRIFVHWLNKIRTQQGGQNIIRARRKCPPLTFQMVYSSPPLLSYLQYFKKAFERKWHKNVCLRFVFQEISTLDDEIIRFSDDNDKLVWFLQPQEAQLFLATDSMKFKILKRTPLPFKPRMSRKFSRVEMVKRRTLAGIIVDRTIHEGKMFCYNKRDQSLRGWIWEKWLEMKKAKNNKNAQCKTIQKRHGKKKSKK